MYLHFIGDQINQYSILPVKIRLADGSAISNLSELTQEQREAIGLYEYQDVTEPYDDQYRAWSGEYTYDHDNRTVSKILTDRPIEQVKAEMLANMLLLQDAIQNAGMTCSNGIKLQVCEQDLSRWTQLMTTILAFQPETVTIRDYDNINHTVLMLEASQMMGEVAAWGQAFLADTWTKKDAITACESIECLEAL